MRLSSLLLLSLLPLSAALAHSPTDTQNDDASIADQMTLFSVKMTVQRSLITPNGHGKRLAKLKRQAVTFVLQH